MIKFVSVARQIESRICKHSRKKKKKFNYTLRKKYKYTHNDNNHSDNTFLNINNNNNNIFQYEKKTVLFHGRSVNGVIQMKPGKINTSFNELQGWKSNSKMVKTNNNNNNDYSNNNNIVYRVWSELKNTNYQRTL